MADQNLRIGFIGIGNMGNPMTANLIKAGWKVTGYDTDAAKLRAFTGKHGGAAAASLAELGGKSDVVVDAQMEAAYPRHYGARVDLELANGERRGSMVLDPHGMPADPCTEAERLDKFSRLASRVKLPAAVGAIIRKVRNAECLSSVREITELLRN